MIKKPPSHWQAIMDWKLQAHEACNAQGLPLWQRIEGWEQKLQHLDAFIRDVNVIGTNLARSIHREWGIPLIAYTRNLPIDKALKPFGSPLPVYNPTDIVYVRPVFMNIVINGMWSGSILAPIQQPGGPVENKPGAFIDLPANDWKAGDKAGIPVRRPKGNVYMHSDAVYTATLDLYQKRESFLARKIKGNWKRIATFGVYSSPVDLEATAYQSEIALIENGFSALGDFGRKTSEKEANLNRGLLSEQAEKLLAYEVIPRWFRSNRKSEATQKLER